MATKASIVLRAARKASLASRAAAAATSRPAAMASRSAPVARVAAGIAGAARLRSDLTCHPKSCSVRSFTTSSDYENLPEDATVPTDKDLESDDAVWALYERWCQAAGKNRNYDEMIRRFKIFRYNAEHVHIWNTGVPADPKKAAICRRKRREVKLLLSKGKDVSHYEDWHLPAMLGPLADGGDPFFRECDYDLLKDLEERDVCLASKDVTVE